MTLSVRPLPFVRSLKAHRNATESMRQRDLTAGLDVCPMPAAPTLPERAPHRCPKDCLEASGAGRRRAGRCVHCRGAPRLGGSERRTEVFRDDVHVVRRTHRGVTAPATARCPEAPPPRPPPAPPAPPPPAAVAPAGPPPAITPSRRRLDNRFPVLAF